MHWRMSILATGTKEDVMVYRDKPSPYQTMVMIASVAGGLAILLTLRQTRVGVALPNWMILYLGCGLIVGGTITLVGSSLNKLNGLAVERTGQFLLFVLLSTFSILLFTVVGTAASISIVYYLSLAIAALWRVKQINMLIKAALEESRRQE